MAFTGPTVRTTGVRHDTNLNVIQSIKRKDMGQILVIANIRRNWFLTRVS